MFTGLLKISHANLYFCEPIPEPFLRLLRNTDVGGGVYPGWEYHAEVDMDDLIFSNYRDSNLLHVASNFCFIFLSIKWSSVS